MEKEITTKLDDSTKFDNIELDKIEKEVVEFQRSWVIWENYALDAPKPNMTMGDADYNERIKSIFNISDLITFWQFWNRYPGANPQNFFYDGEKFTYYFKTNKRIEGINIFAENIMPKWEDPANSGGLTLIMQYEANENNISEFFNKLNEYWLKLVLSVLGESIPASYLVSKSIFNLFFRLMV